MKTIWMAAALAVGSLAVPSTIASAQAPSWNAEQMAVWNVVSQSWVDEAARNGKWPSAYAHDRMVAFDVSYPMPRNRESIEKWTRFDGGRSKVLNYEVHPSAITVVGDTAVVHYTGLSVNQTGTDKPERNSNGFSETLVRSGGQWKFLSSSSWTIGK